MKILFIGGSGNISSAATVLVLEKGYELTHITRGLHAKINGVESLVGDIQNQESTLSMIKNKSWDVVVNFVAFKPNDIKRDFELFRDKTNHYIFISSASAYQKPPVDSVIKESTILENPFWEYSRDKIECEALLNKLFKGEKFPMTIVRPSHTYNTVIPIPIGGWEEYTTVDRIKKGMPIVVHDDGNTLWTLTHAKDFAKGLVGLLENKNSIGEAFHITSDEVLTWNKIHQTIGMCFNKEVEIVNIPSTKIADYADEVNYPSKRGTLLGDKAYNAIFDNSKIKKYVPNFESEILFKEGIQSTIAWFESESGRRKINEQTNQFINELIKKYK